MPMSGSDNVGLRIAGAAALAVEQVNADQGLLPGRVLRYSWADTGCSEQRGLVAMGELLGGNNRVAAVLGPRCSSVCELTSFLSGGHGIPQISWGCHDPQLSDKSRHQLVRTIVATVDC